MCGRSKPKHDCFLLAACWRYPRPSCRQGVLRRDRGRARRDAPFRVPEKRPPTAPYPKCFERPVAFPLLEPLPSLYSFRKNVSWILASKTTSSLAQTTPIPIGKIAPPDGNSPLSYKGQSHAAPRTPLASPCLAGRTCVSASLPKTYSLSLPGTFW